MDEKTNVEAVPEQRTSAELTRAEPVVSAEVTAAFDPSTNVEDTFAGQVPASEPPMTEAEQPAPILDKSLSFLQPGTQPGSLGWLGHYEVLELLGEGGFGIVLKARDEQLQRLVAIKVLGPQFAGNATARSRFVREARAAAAVNNKHVVSTYAVEEQPIPYLVMEYVAGKTLQDRIDQTRSFETRDVLRIGAEIAEGLAAAHQQGLIHRDIKPANILLEVGRVKIADFGLARAVDDASLTQSGVIAGTPRFMSPEQARGEALDHRSDLFSLGSVLYTMCTGQPPFRGHKALGVLKCVCEDTPQPIREINADIPEALADVVNRLLVKDPAGRIQTAAAVAELLQQHLAHLDDPSLPFPAGLLVGDEPTDYLPAVSAQVKAVPSPTKKARRRRTLRLWVAAGCVLLVAVGSLLLFLLPPGPPDQGVPGGNANVTLAQRLPAVLRGEDRPADDAERLAFAQLAYDHKKFASATRLWAEAMASDPKLGDDRQARHRYNAARAAALAAAGQGQDQPPPDDAAKAQLRRQALDWLKAELTAWDKLLESSPPPDRPAIFQTLNQWKEDADLAGLRDAEALAKLPAEEQKAFAQLWADVGALDTSLLLKSAAPPLLKSAALQAWLGQDKELAATCDRALKFAKDTQDPTTAERTAKICSLRPSDDNTHEGALVLARRAVELGNGHQYLVYFQMALGMAEFRSGHYAAADAALLAASRLGNNNYYVSGTTAFYRAMSLFRQGKEAEAHKLATEAVAKMKPLPADEKNPLDGKASADDLILWLAYKEAKALLKLTQ